MTSLTRTRTRTRRLAIGTVIALALVACGDGDDDAALDTTVDTEPAVSDPPSTDPPATDPPATDPPATDPPITEPPATDPPATTTTTTVLSVSESDAETPSTPPATDPPATDVATTEAPPTTIGNDPACLVGDWLITNEEMNAFYDAVVASVATPGLDIDVPSGQVALTLTPDTYRYTADFLLTLDILGSQESGDASGTVSGTWAVSDGIITTTLGESDLSVIIEVQGQTIDGSDIANGILTSVPINDAPFDCAGPTIDFQTGDGTPRHPVTLTPA